MIITIPDEQRRALRREARRLGLSVSELVRRCLDAQLGTPGGLLSAKEAILSISGLGRGDGSEVARRHHDALRAAMEPRRGRLR